MEWYTDMLSYLTCVLHACLLQMNSRSSSSSGSLHKGTWRNIVFLLVPACTILPAEQRRPLSLKEPAMTPKRTKAPDNAQYMESNVVDSYYFVTCMFNLKCFACFFLLVKNVDVLANKTQMCFENVLWKWGRIPGQKDRRSATAQMETNGALQADQWLQWMNQKHTKYRILKSTMPLKLSTNTSHDANVCHYQPYVNVLFRLSSFL